MQDHPGAPGTARQGSTRTIVSTNDGGKATQPRAPGHERPHAASRAARHGRLSAATGAPGADVPPATTAGAPGQYRLSAAPIATASVPAGLRRLRQAVLPRTPATPNTLTYPHSHRDTAKNRAASSPATTYPLSPSTIRQVHPAIQVPPRPRSCSTAGTGFLRQHPSRAPPPAASSLRRKPQSRRAVANPVGASLAGALAPPPPFPFPTREGARG